MVRLRRRVAGLRWWTLPALAAAVIVLIVWMYYPVAAVEYRQARGRARLQAELEALKSRNARLKTEVERLKTPSGVEDYARSQLGMVKKGERPVVVVDGDETAAPSPRAATVIDSDEVVSADGGAWTALLDLIFNVQ